jgi:hypothetical protein
MILCNQVMTEQSAVSTLMGSGYTTAGKNGHHDTKTPRSESEASPQC